MQVVPSIIILMKVMYIYMKRKVRLLFEGSYCNNRFICLVVRPGQTEHGHGGGGALAYGGKPPAAGAVVAAPQPRASPAAPYAPQPYPPTQLRLHQPGYGSAALSYRYCSFTLYILLYSYITRAYTTKYIRMHPFSMLVISTG